MVLISFVSITHTASAQKTMAVDICVYGGTSAGVIAAYTAQKLGKKVLLIEPGSNLGGLSSGGLGFTDIGNKYVVTGLARDFYRRIGRHYGKFEQWIFEPGVAENIFKDYIKEGGINLHYKTRLNAVRKEGNRIVEIVLEDSESQKINTVVKAKVYIDCSYEGDLMAKAGVSYRVGREDNKDYGETLNGVQLMEGHQFPDGIDPYKVPGKPESGLLWGISNEALPSAGTGDKKVQSYNFRICLSTDPKNQVEITRPAGYDSTKYDLLLRLFSAYPQKRELNDYLTMSHMPNHKTDINNRGAFSTDMIGMNYNYPEGTYAQRKQIIRDHENYTKGLLYFLGHDPRVPEPLRKEMRTWGYPKDEYINNGNWSPQMYVREARRMIGSYVMTQANCQGKEVVTDGIGLAAYTMDSHNCQRVVINGQVKNEGDVEVGGFGPYPIAYRSLVPKESECDNILVPVCLSATHIAYGSIRMEPVFMVLAQSSATAAVMAIDEKQSVQQVDVKDLQTRLVKDPLSDGSIFQVLVDNDDPNQTSRTGNWTTETYGGYGPNFLVGQVGGTVKNSFRFMPSIPKAGKYKAYMYFPEMEQGFESVVVVNDGKNKKQMAVTNKDFKVEGQTSGEWVFLGTYLLPEGKGSYIEVAGGNANGKAVVDAIILVPEFDSRQ